MSIFNYTAFRFPFLPHSFFFSFTGFFLTGKKCCIFIQEGGTKVWEYLQGNEREGSRSTSMCWGKKNIYDIYLLAQYPFSVLSWII